MKRTDLKIMYIQLSIHPRFDDLPERYQDMLTYLADGWTISEVSKTFCLHPRAVSTNRHQIFKIMGFKVFENGKTRAMRSEEVAKRLKEATA